MPDAGRYTERLWDEGWRPSPWSNAPGDRYRAHEHPYDKVLVVTAGSIRMGLPATGTVVGPGRRRSPGPAGGHEP